MIRGGRRGAWALAIAAAASFGVAGCKTVHEEIRPVHRARWVETRAGEDVTLSWTGERGTYYSVMYAEDRGAKAQWKLLPDAVNIPGRDGEPIVVKDRAPPSRRYWLKEDTKPLVP